MEEGSAELLSRGKDERKRKAVTKERLMVDINEFPQSHHPFSVRNPCNHTGILRNLLFENFCSLLHEIP